jgi:E3 ubiquitin-protein ligase HUWE1
LEVRRSSLLEDAKKYLLSPRYDFGGIYAQFIGEPGVGPGPTREFFEETTKRLTDPANGIFTLCANGMQYRPLNTQLKGNYSLNFLTLLVSDWEFVGAWIASALINNITIPLRMSKPFLKQIFFEDEPINFSDLESVDPDLYTNLKWMLDNNIEDAALEVTFELQDEDTHSTVLLSPGGGDLYVKEENKVDYVEKVAQYKLVTNGKNNNENFILPVLKRI